MKDQLKLKNGDFSKALISFSRAVQILREGGATALPTETVYGLAGRIDSKSAIEKIFRIKARPLFDPLIVHCYDIHQAKQYVRQPSPLIDRLWDFFTPGPLTLVLLKYPDIF